MEIMMVRIKTSKMVRVIKKEKPSVKTIPLKEEPPLAGHVTSRQAAAMIEPASDIKPIKAVFSFRWKTSTRSTNNAVATRIICGKTACKFITGRVKSNVSIHSSKFIMQKAFVL
jgi:hypothetical protein